MAVGSGILFIVIGAVLRYGITAETPGLDLDIIGLILMTAGAFGALIGLIMSALSSDPTGTHTHEHHDPNADMRGPGRSRHA